MKFKSHLYSLFYIKAKSASPWFSILVMASPCIQASLVAQLVENLPAVWETWVWSQAWEHPMEKGKATHSSILAWRIPWTIKSKGSQRVRHDWATFTYVQWRKGLHRNINTRNQESLRAILEMGYHLGEALWKVFTGQDYLYSIWVNISHIEKQGHAK